MRGERVRLSLEEVSARTGQPVERLREWCATGRLPCDRDASGWRLPEDDLPRVHALALVGPRLSAGRPSDLAGLVAMAFHDQAAATSAFEEIRRSTGTRGDDLAIAPVAIDGMELVMVAGRFPRRHLEAIGEIVERRGGRIVDGLDPTSRTPQADLDTAEGIGA